MMKIFRRIPMPVFLFFLIAITACEKAKPNSIEVVMTAPSTPQPMINRVSSKIVASSFNELIYYSDLIVKGRVVSQEGLINTARNPSDLSEPDPRFYSINQVYKIEAENVLKGEATNTFLVVQNQGLISIPSDGTPTIAEIEDEIKTNLGKTFVPLSIDTVYLFFLRVLDDKNYDLEGYQSGSLYAGLAEPWRFRVTSENFVIPETILSDINACFPPIKIDEVETIVHQNIKNPENGFTNNCDNSYPSPYP